MAEGRRVRKHSESRASGKPLVLLGALALGVVLSAVAWVYLVGAAIDFGVVARSGSPGAWLFTAGASLGAVVCLVLLLALIGRGLRVLGFLSVYRPRRAAPRRRAE